MRAMGAEVCAFGELGAPTFVGNNWERRLQPAEDKECPLKRTLLVDVHGSVRPYRGCAGKFSVTVSVICYPSQRNFDGGLMEPPGIDPANFLCQPAGDVDERFANGWNVRIEHHGNALIAGTANGAIQG